ncbi:MAG TPA: class I SAM-dependent methyltransferase [Nocardioides sp.]|nr:class I SAM-dependent methyltransferase [Nocardioides sp.]
MSFEVAPAAYASFMGRFSVPLATEFADAAGVRPGQRAIDVGCGPGALTDVLVERLGAGQVAAVDPSEPFVTYAADRLTGVDVRRAAAEELPFPDAMFDIALAQLVVHFMADPVAGLREMGRVTRPGGVVAACVWDHAGGSGPLATFWNAVRDTDGDAEDESGLAGVREGHLGELAREAGLTDVEESRLTVGVDYASFEEWWTPYTLGVGPAGAYVGGLDDARRETLRERCAELLPDAPFTVSASAWCLRATPA